MIRTVLAKALSRLANWLAPTGPRSGWGALPGAGRLVAPSHADLLAELKATAWSCASLNASACASFPPRLYVVTRQGEPAPRCLTRPAAKSQCRRRLGERVEEVVAHPLLDLLHQVNPVHNGFDLWELLTLSQEVHGIAYWLLDPGPFGAPVSIWPVPVTQIVPRREENSPNLVDYYLLRTRLGEQRVEPERVIAFRYPDPGNPSGGGLSPLRACYEQARLAGDLTAFKISRFENHALPDAIISPEHGLGEEERDRLEMLWHNRLRRGEGGRVLVTESSIRVQLLQQSMGDLAALADLKATKEEIANAFHVPLAFLTTETNLANLQAAEQQHATQAIRPRLRRRDEKLNEQLIPLFDPSGRLFLASDDPIPANRELALRELALHLKYGVRTIDEVRAELGLSPRS